VMNREAQPLAELAPDVPPDLVDLIHGLLQKDPAQRFGPAEAVARALTDATGTSSGFAAGTMVLGPADGTMMLPGAGTRAGVGTGTGLGAGTGAGTSAGGATAPEPTVLRRAPLWRRPLLWGPLAVIVVGLLIWVGMNLQRDGTGGADRLRAETLNVLGMEKLGILTNQLGPKDKDLVSETRELFQNALAADSTYAVPHNNLGKLAQIMGDRAGARREYETALQLDPKYAAAYVNMATFLESEGRPEEAEYYYRSAIRFDDSDSLFAMKTAANNLGYFYLATMGRPDSALAVLAPVVERFPRIPALSKNYGLALLAQGRIEEAEAAFNRVLAVDRKFLPAVAGLAAAAEARGDSLVAAERWAEVVAALGPTDADYLRRTTLQLAAADSARTPR
jgi:Tfp pilus assembly protein PilF